MFITTVLPAAEGYRELYFAAVLMLMLKVLTGIVLFGFTIFLSRLNKKTWIANNLAMLACVLGIAILFGDSIIIMGISIFITFILHNTGWENGKPCFDFLSMTLLAMLAYYLWHIEIGGANFAFAASIPGLYVAYNTKKKDLKVFSYILLLLTHAVSFQDAGSLMYVFLFDLLVVSVMVLMHTIHGNDEPLGVAFIYLYALLCEIQYFNVLLGILFSMFYPDYAYNLRATVLVCLTALVLMSNLLFKYWAYRKSAMAFDRLILSVNGGVMAASSVLMFMLGASLPLHILAVVIAVISFTANSEKFLWKKILSVWVFMKYLLLSGIILASFGAPVFNYSICAIVMSIIVAAYGSRHHMFYPCVFGFVTGLAGAVKLSLFDYATSIGKAEIIACAISCMTICAVYGIIFMKVFHKRKSESHRKE